jgi:hypothetical protein
METRLVMRQIQDEQKDKLEVRVFLYFKLYVREHQLRPSRPSCAI